MGEVLYRSWYGQNLVGEWPVKYCLPDRWNTARLPVPISARRATAQFRRGAWSIPKRFSEPSRLAIDSLRRSI